MKKVHLAKPARLPDASGRAKTLRLPVTVEAQYAEQWRQLVQQMHEETVATVKRHFANTVATDAMDAEGGGFWDSLVARLTQRFEQRGANIINGMLGRLDKTARSGLERSLREVSQDFTFKQQNSKRVQAAINERVKDNANLIKRIPQEYLESVREAVQASVDNGNGLQDLVPIMEEKYGEAKRHAKNVALDQTRKAYTAINVARMKDVGVSKFEWVHTGGSQQPRPYHLHSVAAGGLNGGVFSINNPPIIDEKTGERGLPGQAINCRCTMRPIVTFEDDDDAAEDGE